MLNSHPERCAKFDKELARIVEWGKSEHLSFDALQVFVFNMGVRANHPHNELVRLFRAKKALLLRPLKEVDTLLDSSAQWEKFSLCLRYSGVNYSRENAKNSREKLHKAAEIKKEITQKTREIVDLAYQMQNLGEYSSLGMPFIFPDLLRMAAEIQNERYEKIKLPNLPGLSHAHQCRYLDIAKKFESLLDASLDQHPLPIIESVILAYALFIQDQSSIDYTGVLRFSQRASSPADFIRGLVSDLLYHVQMGDLPKKIQSLSNGSLNSTLSDLFQRHLRSSGVRFFGLSPEIMPLADNVRQFFSRKLSPWEQMLQCRY